MLKSDMHLSRTYYCRKCRATITPKHTYRGIEYRCRRCNTYCLIVPNKTLPGRGAVSYVEIPFGYIIYVWDGTKESGFVCGGRLQTKNKGYSKVKTH